MLSDSSLDLFNWYLHERERIRLKKEAGKPAPYTDNPILSQYKFTNILRSNDKTSRWVTKNWYEPNRDKPLAVQAMSCAIFRYFGTIEFAEDCGYPEKFDPDYLIAKAEERFAAGKKVFTGAYIITNGGISAPKQNIVAYNYLAPLFEQIDFIVDVAQKTNSWEVVGKHLKKLPGMGNFMSKEILLDMMLTPVLENCTDKLSWTPAGPGAIRGLNRLHGRPVDAALSQDKALTEMKEILQRLSLEKKFEGWMPKLGVEFGVTDVQFSLCEVDKYLRVKNGEGRPRSKYNAFK